MKNMVILVVIMSTLVKAPHLSLPAAYVGLLLGLNFNPEDGGYMFLQNVGLCPNYTVLYSAFK
jgi:hypothetical protein